MDDFEWSGEQVVLCKDDALGLRAVIAVDSTVLGGGLGGVRFKHYPSYGAGIREAQRLAAAMTLKNAAAGLGYGGAKAVIFATEPGDRRAFMRAFGEFTARLGGSYLPGVDMGTTMDDLRWMAEGGAPVISGEENPSPSTAVGVHHAIRAAVAHRFGADTLDGRTVLVQGVGHVGASLARLAAADGARLLLSDLDGERAAALARELGGRVVPPEEVTATPCDVYAPCAAARVVHPGSIATLRCDIIAGAANDTLAHPSCADLLHARGITYVPDFVANAGGVIQMDAVHRGLSQGELDDALAAIGTRVARLLAESDAEGITPLAAAERAARARLAGAA
ncbi:leucine dehydrogenase [Thermocatellispora tengchongensis]|uniref:Leucine dehydrogenase n=1 Tax=Thermocatellispora tengchongensis TaxID=1073253 RepID=A0A840PPF0_9ACTN|nr:Glu/Leu/Phe/Val dehydrogenase family protein [Thermocatellispora tengchongensis]MBB5137895.1 leucine dehydrogenase [Thermocatellispora tengchongensis]